MINEHLREEKLKELLGQLGYKSLEEFNREASTRMLTGFEDAEGICMNQGCDYTTFCELDADQNWCEIYDTNTLASVLVLGNFI